MKPKFTTVEGIPNWAACYFVNNDDSALSEEDKATADAYVDRLLKEGLSLVCPKEGTERDFNPYPAFGLACDTTDWTAQIVEKKAK